MPLAQPTAAVSLALSIGIVAVAILLSIWLWYERRVRDPDLLRSRRPGISNGRISGGARPLLDPPQSWPGRSTLDRRWNPKWGPEELCVLCNLAFRRRPDLEPAPACDARLVGHSALCEDIFNSFPASDWKSSASNSGNLLRLPTRKAAMVGESFGPLTRRIGRLRRLPARHLGAGSRWRPGRGDVLGAF